MTMAFESARERFCGESETRCNISPGPTFASFRAMENGKPRAEYCGHRPFCPSDCQWTSADSVNTSRLRNEASMIIMAPWAAARVRGMSRVEQR